MVICDTFLDIRGRIRTKHERAVRSPRLSRKVNENEVLSEGLVIIRLWKLLPIEILENEIVTQVV